MLTCHGFSLTKCICCCLVLQEDVSEFFSDQLIKDGDDVTPSTLLADVMSTDLKVRPFACS